MASFISTLDEAIKTLVFNKFKTYLALTTQNTDLVFAPKLIAPRMLADKRGQNWSEFISIYRDLPVFDWQRQRSPTARRGFDVAFEDAGRTSLVNIKAVPADINYSLYFWSKSLEKLNLIAEQYLFWIHNNPELSIYFNDIYLMEIDMDFGEMIDESPLDQAYDKGVYFVYKAPLKLKSWIVTAPTTDIKTILEIIMKVYYNDNLETAVPANSTLLAQYNIVTSDES